MHRRRSGLTLLELIVVVAILAALAGLVISKVDWFRRQANMAVGADSCAEIARNLQMYIAQTETLPNGLDTLLGTSGALYSGPSAANGTGGVIGITDGVGNLPTQTTPTTIPASDKRLNSLFRVGMRFVNNHDTTTSASDSGTQQQLIGTISGGASTFPSPVPLLLVNTNSTIWKSVYPVNVWGTPTDTTTMQVDASGATVSLACLGLGPNSSINGVTMTSAPIYPGPNSNIYYYRYVALFSIYSDGRRAQLKGVVDPYGRTVNSSLSQYSTSGPDDLPPGVSRTPE